MTDVMVATLLWGGVWDGHGYRGILALRIQVLFAESSVELDLPRLSPDLELRVLRRTRTVMAWQKWLFAPSITFTALSLSSELSFDRCRVTDFHLLIRDYPQQFGFLPRWRSSAGPAITSFEDAYARTSLGNPPTWRSSTVAETCYFRPAHTRKFIYCCVDASCVVSMNSICLYSAP